MVVCWELLTIRVISCLELRVSFLFFANFLSRQRNTTQSDTCRSPLKNQRNPRDLRNLRNLRDLKKLRNLKDLKN